ncbi:MAG: PASTA domain-containing protein [Elusimicrobia bacterium]|nr:PASTA domain-containing protein [Elusimicrobiota bacterium]
MTTRNDQTTLWEMAAAAAVVGAFGWWALNWGMDGAVHNRRTQTLPDLKGRSLSAALDLLAPLNIGLRKAGVEFNAAVPIASVLRQDPGAGTVVREGKIVRVVVSEGGRTVLAPAVVGLPLRNAEMMLRQAQLLLGEVGTQYSLKAEKGLVLAQDPKSETSVEKNATVNLVVSGGAPPAGVTLMPDFSRKTLSSVHAWAAGAGLQVAVQTDESSPFPGGTVLTQTPAPDSALASDAKVTVLVSGRRGAAPDAGEKIFHYELSQGGSDSQVRIVMVDKYGERELFNGLRKPGAKIDVPVQAAGGGHVKIYVNGVLVEEREL